MSLALYCLGLLGACDDQDACEAHKSKIESCNRRFQVDVCNTAEDRCYTACYAKLSCDEFEDIDNGRRPADFSQCVVPCAKKFTCDNDDEIADWWRCDASRDCVDGSDERGCDYFECKSGQLVRKTARCDGYPQCNDESDEVDCP